MQVTVIIPTFNECKNVKKCVQSFLMADSKNRIDEIIIIDDGSTDKTIQHIRGMKDPRVHVYLKNHNKYRRGKSDSIYVGAHLSSNPVCLVADCDTLARDLTNSIDLMEQGNDLVGIRIGIIENGSLIAKCEKIEYDISMNHIKPYVKEKINVLMNVSGAAFLIKKEHLINYKVPAHIMGEDFYYSLLAPIHKWKTAISTSIVDTYSVPNLKALFIQRNRWTNGYYQIIANTKYYWRLIDSVAIYYRTIAMAAGIATIGVFTANWFLMTAIVLGVYFLNDYRFIKNVRMTLIMLIYRQINFISALTFPIYGRKWRVIR